MLPGNERKNAIKPEGTTQLNGNALTGIDRRGPGCYVGALGGTKLQGGPDYWDDGGRSSLGTKEPSAGKTYKKRPRATSVTAILQCTRADTEKDRMVLCWE